MDPAKAAFVFGDAPVPDGADGEALDEDRLQELVADRLGLDVGDPRELLEASVATVVASQVLAGDPPEVWATAERLVAAGLDERRAFVNLVYALLRPLQRALVTKAAFDVDAYRAALDALPIPTSREVADADDEPFDTLVDRVIDPLLDIRGRLEILVGDVVVEPATLCAGIVLTHRLTAEECEDDALGFDADLAPLAAAFPTARWDGPPGWLARFAPGDLVAVRVTDDTDDGVEVEPVTEPPAEDQRVVALVRAVYDDEVAEPGLPTDTIRLVLGVLARDRDAFARPRPPLTDLCAAAGLELRGINVADDPQMWVEDARMHRYMRLHDRLENGSTRATVLAFIDATDDGADPVDDATLRRQLRVLCDDADALSTVAEELLARGDDAPSPTLTAAIERAVGVAGRPEEIAPARWLAAVAAERRDDVATAEAHLRLAVDAAPGWGPAADRLAWYRSDRGDAAGALALWRGLGFTADTSPDVAVVERATATTPRPGRNDPCWCGSGRKYKVCHRDQPPIAPLADRVGWLWCKAIGYLERAGAVVDDEVAELAYALGGDDDVDPTDAMADPLVAECALFELGWLDRFLDERGPLLPDDEAMLARSWTLVDRTLYEVADVDPGRGLRLRDVRTGDVVDVRERVFSTVTRAGELLCGRAVPDGETHQLVGSPLRVRPGLEQQLLDLLDDGDPYALLEWVAQYRRPPEVRTRENEPIVHCTVELDVPDAAAARRFLDARYEPGDDGTWVDVLELGGGELLHRAGLTLDGTRLTVDTMSEPRADRVIATVVDGLPGASVVRDERTPFDVAAAAEAAAAAAPRPTAPLDAATRAAMEDFQATYERKWCDESIPALGGLTPREAAADPTRREQLVRLIDSFPEPDPDTFVTRPSRLRALLGLDG